MKKLAKAAAFVILAWTALLVAAPFIRNNPEAAGVFGDLLMLVLGVLSVGSVLVFMLVFMGTGDRKAALADDGVRTGRVLLGARILFVSFGVGGCGLIIGLALEDQSSLLSWSPGKWLFLGFPFLLFVCMVLFAVAAKVRWTDVWIEGTTDLLVLRRHRWSDLISLHNESEEVLLKFRSAGKLSVWKLYQGVDEILAVAERHLPDAGTPRS